MKNINKVFHMGNTEFHVLHNINLSVEKGEFLAITGPSGSGKSTLMHLIGCLDTPTSGTYYFGGNDVSQMSDSQLAKIRNKYIGFVFQKFHLLPDLDAVDNVALPQLYANKSEAQARKDAEKVLEQLGLGDRLHHFPNQLSGGQQQRVAIARALVNNPDLILADEPTGNLDTTTGANIVETFIRLHREQNVTVILVTHDLELAKKTNRMIKLLDGAIIEDKLAH